MLWCNNCVCIYNNWILVVSHFRNICNEYIYLLQQNHVVNKWGNMSYYFCLSGVCLTTYLYSHDYKHTHTWQRKLLWALQLLLTEWLNKTQIYMLVQVSIYMYHVTRHTHPHLTTHTHTHTRTLTTTHHPPSHPTHTHTHTHTFMYNVHRIIFPQKQIGELKCMT